MQLFTCSIIVAGVNQVTHSNRREASDDKENAKPSEYFEATTKYEDRQDSSEDYHSTWKVQKIEWQLSIRLIHVSTTLCLVSGMSNSEDGQRPGPETKRKKPREVTLLGYKYEMSHQTRVL
jgi:hypothetical protein